MNLALVLLINTLSIAIAAYILPGVSVSNFAVAFVVAVVLGIINTFIRPILVFFTLPLTILTLGLFIFVIDALLVLLVSAIVPGFRVHNFGWALLFSLIISIINLFLISII